MPLFIPTLIFAISLSLLPSTQPDTGDEEYAAEDHKAYSKSRRAMAKASDSYEAWGQRSVCNEQRGGGLPCRSGKIGEDSTDAENPERLARTKGREAEDSLVPAQSRLVSYCSLRISQSSSTHPQTVQRRESLNRRRCISMPPLPLPTSHAEDTLASTLARPAPASP